MAKNTLEIVIKADSSKAAAEIKKLEANFGKIGVAVDKFKGQFKSFVDIKAFTDMAGTVIDRVFDIGKAIKGLADDFMNYAFQVEDFGRIIGATPEEASKLIQVADDVRLSVESMTMAMRSAITKGYAPTVAELGKMSDAYLSIQDPIARSKFLIETFGRSGLEMAKLMELGSGKISEMGDSIEGTARLMTSEGIKSAKAYYEALDSLGDAIQGVTLALGSRLTPAITGVAGGLTGFVEDGIKVADMFGTMQAAMEAGTASLSDVQDAFIYYMTATKTADQITAEFNARMGITGVVLADSTNALIEERKALQYTADGVKVTSASFAAGMGEVQRFGAALSNVSDEASKIKTIDAKLEFSFPNFADKMKNLIDSVNWNAAGGSALDQFMQGFSADIAGKAPEVQKQIAADVGAVDIALRVETGEITKSEGVQQLMDLAGTDYSKAKSDIEAIMKLEPADITPYLENIIGLGENTPEAAKQTEELSLKIGATDTAMKLGQASFSNWNTMTDDLEEKARQAATQVGALNTQLKNIPETIDVKINITSSGGGGTGGTHGGGNTTATGLPGQHFRAGGGTVSPNQWYMVGERGPELFIPNTAGRIIPNSQITNNNSADKTIYITNNYTIAATKEINVRELARQVAREQQRAGVT